MDVEFPGSVFVGCGGDAAHYGFPVEEVGGGDGGEVGEGGGGVGGCGFELLEEAFGGWGGGGAGGCGHCGIWEWGRGGCA